MNDSTENQQVKKGNVNDVPVGKQPLPHGQLGRLDHSIEVSINMISSNLIIDDQLSTARRRLFQYRVTNRHARTIIEPC